MTYDTTTEYYFSQTLKIPCRLKKVKHDGDPNQEFPTGLYLATVEVREDSDYYKEDEQYVFGAENVFNMAGESIHDLVKAGRLYIGDY